MPVIDPGPATDAALNTKCIKLLDEVDEFMNDDLNTAKVLANFFELVPVINSLRDGHLAATALEAGTLTRIQQTFKTYLEDIFGLIQENSQDSGKLSNVMQLLIDIRKEARTKKDFMTSDKIRNQLQEMGIQLKDEKDGSMNWSLISNA
jgi:cysteinyl-tRNA synthetase